MSVRAADRSISSNFLDRVDDLSGGSGDFNFVADGFADEGLTQGRFVADFLLGRVGFPFTNNGEFVSGAVDGNRDFAANPNLRLAGGGLNDLGTGEDVGQFFDFPDQGGVVVTGGVIFSVLGEITKSPRGSDAFNGGREFVVF